MKPEHPVAQAPMRRLSAAAYAGMFVFGIVMALLGAVLPAVSQRLAVGLARAGNLFLVMNCSMLVCQLALGPLMDRFGKKPPMIAAPLLVAASLTMVAAAGSYRTLMMAMVLLGFGGGALNGATNTLIADLHEEPRRKSAALSLLGMFFGLGAVLLPFTIGSLIERLGLAVILQAAAVLSLAPAVLSALLEFPEPLHAGRVPLAEVGRFARRPLVLAFAFLLFFQSGNEFILGGFTATFLTREIGVGIAESSFLLALYWGTIVVARMVLSRILMRIRGGTVIRFSSLCAVLGVGLLAMAGSDISAVPALVLTGLGVASIFPATLGLAGTRFAEYSGTVFGILFGVALTGGMTLPWALGQLGAAYGLRESLMLPVFGFLMIFFLQTFLDRALRAPRAVGAVLVLLLCAGAAHAQKFQAADSIPMAVWYSGGKARAPMLEPPPDARRKEQWRADLKQIRSLGFNTIRTWIDWASGEPAEGRYRFDNLDALLDLAEQEGLRVVIQTYMDAAPDWVGRKFPDSLYETAGGEKMKSESSPGFCFDHAGVRKAELAFFTALARRAGGSKAFLGWDLWSEPHVINWATANYLYRPEFCFCPSSVARFRDWLRSRYGTLDRLNRAWYRRYESWGEVEPGRLSTILSYTDYIDWRAFIQQKLGEDLRFRYDAVKRGAPDRIATSHAAIPSLFTSPHAGDGAPDDWTMIRQVDYYGTSFYPKHSMPVGRDPAWRAALLDFERSSAYSPNGHGGFWVGELQAGFGTVALNVSATVTARDLRMWTWSALARGAKAINYYAWYPMSTGYESGGFGLIQLDGTITDRARAAGEVARVVERNQQLLLSARPSKAQVAIIYNPLAYMVGGRQRAATFTGPQSEVGSIERDSWLGAYRALFPTNVPVDFVHLNEVTAENLTGYKLVIFPYPLMMPAASAAALGEYVHNGGTLVSEARLGWNNETGAASETIPGLGLHTVTGARETAVQSVAGLKTELLWTSGEILKPGDRLPARLYEETLEPEGPRARVVAKFSGGAPAAIVSTWGKGRTLTLGSYLAVAYEVQRDPALARFFNALLDWAGVDRPVEAPVEVRWLESGTEKIVFVFNHEEKDVAATIRLRMPASSATDFVTGAQVPLPPQKVLAPQEVWILRIK